MFIAYDESKKRVDINDADKSKQYYCPICGEKLIIKAKDSLAVKRHFAHKKGAECLDTWQHDMSEWHYNWQCLFPEECREVVVEKFGVKHRADVLINKFVVELQHSPITAAEIMERNNFYLACGYTVIWVFDSQNKVKSGYTTYKTVNPFLTTLEWKRARREFHIPTLNGVCVFIEYKTDVPANPQQEEDILLFLKKFEPKSIDPWDTNPFYIKRENLLKTLGIGADDVLSINDIFMAHKKYINQTTREPIYIKRKLQTRRRFRF
ncbi:MAG: hypothetical protein IJE50_05685 [Clostridia bacterium]|nr:hypothetical protein [Clostridia bacterium]